MRPSSPRHEQTWKFGVACGLALAGFGGQAFAGPVAFADPRLAAPDTLSVSVPGVTPGGPLPTNYTADGRNVSPPTSWTKGPPGTKAYVVVMQDPDAPGSDAAVHWLAYAIPPSLTALPRGMKNVAAPKTPLGVLQGPNFHDSIGYSGPRPPPGDPPHHYHLQVFAVDAAMRIHAGADLASVERAMAGHVIARGELVATYAALPPKSPPPHPETSGARAPPGASS